MRVPPRSTTQPVATWPDEDDAADAGTTVAPTPAHEAPPPRAPVARASLDDPANPAARPKRPGKRRGGGGRSASGPKDATTRTRGKRVLLACLLLFVIYVGIAGALRPYWRRNAAGRGDQAGGGPAATQGPITIEQAGQLVRQELAKAEATPVQLPKFPALGPGRAIEPGVSLHEVNLGPLNTAIESPRAAQGGRLWVYLPSGSEGADHALPCILITAAGTKMLSGNTLGEGSRAEHLPYARAGFAVVAFEMDGSTPDNPPERVFNEGMYRFARARAGLANARVAFEYARRMIPAVDPARISIAGHSSAGAVALLFAATEPKLRSAVAYAPAIDLEGYFGPDLVGKLQRAGFGDLAVRFSPKNYCRKLLCPLFLFQARDDSATPFAEAQAFADRLQGQGDPVTFSAVATGDHYQSMIDRGIPRAIAWLKGEPMPTGEGPVARRSDRPAPGSNPDPDAPPGLDPDGRARAQRERIQGKIDAIRQRQEQLRQGRGRPGPRP